MELEKNFEKHHRKNINRARELVDRNFKLTSTRIAALLARYDLRNPESFTFARVKDIGAKMNKLIGSLATNLERSVVQSVVISWGLANQKNDELTVQYMRSISAATDIEKNYFAFNINAMNEFIRRTEDGMNLSKRIWQITETLKSQLEAYVGTGITAGRSADKISQDIRYLLKYPDKLFRRVRNETGKLVLSEAAKAFHPGAGVYRSAYKNALRLAATETNMAYRMSDYARRQQLDFVKGIKIHLSSSHSKPDICDYMAGVYTKSFVFRGWHPWCLCFTTSILMSGSEFRKLGAMFQI